jgi:Zn-dependent peptidase ImmA (M78 family)
MGLDTKAASKKVTASRRDIVSEWEKGNELPKWSQVSKLAKAYNIPELLFFSKETLVKNEAIPDYRVGSNPKDDEKVQKLINLVVTRQKQLERYAREDGFTKNQLQGSGKEVGSPKKLAGLMTEKLGIDMARIKKASGRKEVLDYLISKAEAKGIFVGKTIAQHRISVKDMRGLYVSHDYCPFIIINRKDSWSAQIFSFVHELSHFFRKSDAVSNSLEFRKTGRDADPEEIFCNRVAAELLMPENEFTKGYYDKRDINIASDLYKVSPIAIFYRLKELGKIQEGMEQEIEREIRKEMDEGLSAKAEKDKQKSGGSHVNNMRDSNGDLFNRIVQRSYLDNNMGYVEAANLLRFSPEQI